MKIRIACPHCGFTKEVPAERVPVKARFAACPHCREHFPLRPDDQSGPLPPSTDPVTTVGSTDTAAFPSDASHSVRGPSPWEERDRVGLWKGIYRSFLKTLVSPASFFRTMHTRQGLKEPLAMGLLFGSIGLMTGLFKEFVLSVWGYGSGVRIFSSGVDSPFVLSALMAFAPIVAGIGIFMLSGFLHLFLLVFRSASRGFEGTFRVVAYGQVTQVFGVVPVLGGIIGGLWYLVILVVGMREIHETSYSRVVLAFLMPLLLMAAIALAVLIPMIISLLNRLL